MPERIAARVSLDNLRRAVRQKGDARMSDTPQFAWHVHHEVLVEALREPIEVRQRYIRECKSPEEQELRLRLLKPVCGELPSEVVEAGLAHGEAWRAYDEARHAYGEAITRNLPAIEALHAIECPNCPWDGYTIFAGEED